MRRLWRTASRFVGYLALGLSLSCLSGLLGVVRYRSAEAVIGGNFYCLCDQGYLRATDDRLWEWTEHSGLAAEWWQFIHLPQANIPGPLPGPAEYKRGLAERYGTPRDCSAFGEILADGLRTTSYSIVNRLDVGWPFRSFTLVTAEVARNDRITGGTVWRGLDLQGGTMPEWAYPVGIPGGIGRSLLPTSPMSGALIANCLFWASAAYMLMHGPAVLRRKFRELRGRCGSCGYDIRTLAHRHCPECGKLAVKARARDTKGA